MNPLSHQNHKQMGGGVEQSIHPLDFSHRVDGSYMSERLNIIGTSVAYSNEHAVFGQVLYCCHPEKNVCYENLSFVVHLCKFQPL